MVSSQGVRTADRALAAVAAGRGFRGSGRAERTEGRIAARAGNQLYK
ncbi:hypothetical protein GCM10022416_37850 [Actinomadura keratinilytica]|uniref:TetR family transcriptional regulator n=1 Tax=Actinomadura keratinilytica TaxID=547461 RepID=A0ABP7Z265_9ACTN